MSICYVFTRKTRLIRVLQSRISGLRKAGGALLALYIKEIDVLTKEKLTAIRRMRHMLRGE